MAAPMPGAPSLSQELSDRRAILASLIAPPRDCRRPCAHYVQETIGLQYSVPVGRVLQSLAGGRFYSSARGR
jgi:hypothetical protein